jgi:hypothetical protein
MAVCVVLSFLCYLRPFEVMRLTGSCLIPPVAASGTHLDSWGLLLNPSAAGAPGKTNLMDESVHVDLDQFLWPVLAALKAATPDTCSLWDFSVVELRKEFAQCSELLELSALNPQLYSLRHGGASHDLLAMRRPVAAVQRLGRWAAPSSMKRYAKETHLQAALARVPDWVLVYGGLVEAHFRRLLESGYSADLLRLMPGRANRLLAAGGRQVVSAHAKRRRLQ